MATTVESEVEPTNTEEIEVAFRDLIPRGPCTIEQCARALGLEQRQIRRALYDGHVSGHSAAINTASVARWLETENVAFCLDEQMVARHARQARRQAETDAARAEAAAVRAADPVTKAFGEIDAAAKNVYENQSIRAPSDEAL